MRKKVGESGPTSRWLMHLFRYYAKFEKQNTELMFWQKTSHPVELCGAARRSNRMINQNRSAGRLNYIHMNPVKAGIVLEPQHYLYSSACPEPPLAVLDAY